MTRVEIIEKNREQWAKWVDLRENIGEWFAQFTERIKKINARYGAGGWPTRDQTQDEEC